MNAPPNAAPEAVSFGAGCFWGVEARFRALPGVLRTTAGYQGGTVARPRYEDVCGGRSGHAEVVRVEYDPARISFEALLDAFFELHNPTRAARAADGRRSHYRSAIFPDTPEQAEAARRRLLRLAEAGRYPAPIRTEVVLDAPFWPAEERHQDYSGRHRRAPACAAG